VRAASARPRRLVPTLLSLCLHRRWAHRQMHRQCSIRCSTSGAVRPSTHATANTGGGPKEPCRSSPRPQQRHASSRSMALASPSQHPLATLCRLGYAAAPRAALLAGGLTAHSNPPCRVSRPSPRQAERRGTPALSAHGGHLSPCVTCDRMAAIHTLAKEAGKGLLRRRQPTESLTEACLVEGLLHPSHTAPLRKLAFGSGCHDQVRMRMYLRPRNMPTA